MPLNQGAGFRLIKFDESDLKQELKQKNSNLIFKKGCDRMAISNTPSTYKSTGQTKMRYQVTDATGTTEWMNLRQLCRHFGFKYGVMYNKVVKKGMDIQDAVMECRDDPYAWGE